MVSKARSDADVQEAIKHVEETIKSGGYRANELVVLCARGGKGKTVIVDANAVRAKLNSKGSTEGA